MVITYKKRCNRCGKTKVMEHNQYGYCGECLQVKIDAL